MGSNTLDIRIIQLAKWKTPKSKSAFFLNDENAYLSIGYFDMFYVKKVEYKEGRHPLSLAYRGLLRMRQNDEVKKEISENYTLQELIIFTNVGTSGFQSVAVDKFWKNRALQMFISLIHIDNESNIDKIVERIGNIFKGTDYLYYFSFDYGGIVIFAKGISMEQYFAKIFELDYGKVGEERLVRDSYSFYGFRKGELKKYFALFEQRGYASVELLGQGIMSVSVNIGIQNIDMYKQFVEELRMIETEGAEGIVEEYHLLGRHDVSLVNQHASLKWLIYVQYLLDKYAQCDGTDEWGRVFFTHETFVKMRLDANQYQGSSVKKDSFYQRAKDRLQKCCTQFLEKLEENANIFNGEYAVPVQAVEYSILGILKSRFAEDFVLCIFQSFCEFLEYMTEQISQPTMILDGKNKKESEFDKCFEQYFRGLNSLVDSAMYSERQFIQATAFDAIIYGVPSKIMAFYVAMIQKIQNLMKGEEDKKYIFLLTPNFHNEITVGIISFSSEERTKPQDRILMVKINEKSLYNPQNVIQRMAHEVAHFVGDELRCRKSRKKFIKYSLINILLSQLLFKSFIEEEGYSELARKVYEGLPQNKVFYEDCNNYSRSLGVLADEMVFEFTKNEELRSILRGHILTVMQKYFSIEYKDSKERKEIVQYISAIMFREEGARGTVVGTLLNKEECSQSELRILVQIITEDMDRELCFLEQKRNGMLHSKPIDRSINCEMSGRIFASKTPQECGEQLVLAYSEAFSDIQMVFLTNIGYEEYLKGFLREENLDLSKLPECMQDFSRISMVAFVLHEIGIWNIQGERAAYDADGALADFHKLIIGAIKRLQGGVKEGFGKLFEPVRKDTRVFLENTGENGREESCYLVQAEGEASEDNLTAILDLQLVYYLTKCASRSLMHYGKKENARNVLELRKALNVMNECNDMKEVFGMVCKELDEYKRSLF